MTDLRNDSPRRYFVDDHGRRVLVGLTHEETDEFETLDSQAASHRRGGQVLGEGGGLPVGRQDRRWLELYAKHERAWGQWMADRSAESDRTPPFLN